MPKMRDNAAVRRFSFVAPHRCKPKCKEHTELKPIKIEAVFEPPVPPKVEEQLAPKPSGFFRRAIDFLFGRNKEDNNNE